MIKHIVMFRLLDNAERADKNKNAKAIKKLLDELPSKIPQIQGYEVGINIKQSERASDLVLISSFDNIEDLNKYLNHPEHIKALNFVRKRTNEVRAVDYEI